MMGGAAGGCYCGVVVSGIALFLVHVGKAESKSITLSSLQTGLNVYIYIYDSLLVFSCTKLIET